MRKFVKYCFNTSAWNPNKVEWIQLLSSVTKEERDKVMRFTFKNNSKQTLLGRVLIRYCLQKLLNIEWSNLCIGQSAKDRPYLKIKETLDMAKLSSMPYYVDFNVSHSGDYTIIFAGISSLNSSSSSSKSKSSDIDMDDYFKLGTDVMKIEVDERTRLSHPHDQEEAIFQIELNRHERVISSKFSTNEQNFIYSKISPVEKLSAFYRLWALKESYVKALGDGIGFELKRIEVVPPSELFIDLISKRHLVANDTQIFVDSKLTKNVKFYEQYFTNNLLNPKEDGQHGKTQLHIISSCIVDKEKSQQQQQSSDGTEMKEFCEINLEDILTSIISCSSLDSIDDGNRQEYEEYWMKFTQKTDSPMTMPIA